ncbi:hypothetical protein ACFL1B_04445, partial [Nanoarchaeota archaeon]
ICKNNECTCSTIPTGNGTTGTGTMHCVTHADCGECEKYGTEPKCSTSGNCVCATWPSIQCEIDNLCTRDAQCYGGAPHCSTSNPNWAGGAGRCDCDGLVTECQDNSDCTACPAGTKPNCNSARKVCGCYYSTDPAYTVGDGRCDTGRGETHDNSPDDCWGERDSKCETAKGENEQNSPDDCYSQFNNNCAPQGMSPRAAGYKTGKIVQISPTDYGPEYVYYTDCCQGLDEVSTALEGRSEILCLPECIKGPRNSDGSCPVANGYATLGTATNPQPTGSEQPGVCITQECMDTITETFYQRLWIPSYLPDSDARAYYDALSYGIIDTSLQGYINWAHQKKQTAPVEPVVPTGLGIPSTPGSQCKTVSDCGNYISYCDNGYCVYGGAVNERCIQEGFAGTCCPGLVDFNGICRTPCTAGENTRQSDGSCTPVTSAWPIQPYSTDPGVHAGCTNAACAQSAAEDRFGYLLQLDLVRAQYPHDQAFHNAYTAGDVIDAAGLKFYRAVADGIVPNTAKGYHTFLVFDAKGRTALTAEQQAWFDRWDPTYSGTNLVLPAFHFMIPDWDYGRTSTNSKSYYLHGQPGYIDTGATSIAVTITNDGTNGLGNTVGSITLHDYGPCETYISPPSTNAPYAPEGTYTLFPMQRQGNMLSGNIMLQQGTGRSSDGTGWYSLAVECELPDGNIHKAQANLVIRKTQVLQPACLEGTEDLAYAGYIGTYGVWDAEVGVFLPVPMTDGGGQAYSQGSVRMADTADRLIKNPDHTTTPYTGTLSNNYAPGEACAFFTLTYDEMTAPATKISGLPTTSGVNGYPLNPWGGDLGVALPNVHYVPGQGWMDEYAVDVFGHTNIAFSASCMDPSCMTDQRLFLFRPLTATEKAGMERYFAKQCEAHDTCPINIGCRDTVIDPDNPWGGYYGWSAKRVNLYTMEEDGRNAEGNPRLAWYEPRPSYNAPLLGWADLYGDFQGGYTLADCP